MEPDDTQYVPAGHDGGQGGQQRSYRGNPYQGDYELTGNTPKRRRAENTSDLPQPSIQYQPFYNEMALPQVPMPSPRRPPSSQSSQLQTQRFTPITLLQFNENVPQNMSSLDALICQNVELFQSFAEEGPQSAQLGLRCVHCARAMQRHVDSCIIFPSSIETMSTSVRLIKERHFPSCNTLPIDTRHNFNRLHNSSHRNHENEESPQGRFSLSEFLYNLCKMSNIVNRQPIQTGIIAADVTSHDSSFHNSDSESTSHYVSTVIPARKAPTYNNPTHNLVGMAGGQYSPRAQHKTYQSQLQVPSQNYYQTSSYDNPNDDKFPFTQTAHNIWECKHCLNLPIGHRGERYAWYSPSPPNKTFMDDHLRTCSGRRQRQQFSSYSQNQQQNYSSQQQQHQNYSFQNTGKQYSSVPSYNRPPQPQRTYQQDQMQMKSTYPLSQTSKQFSSGMHSQQHQSPVLPTYPYQNTYQQNTFRPSLPHSGFSSASQGLQPSSDLSYLKTPSKGPSTYDQRDPNKASNRSQPETSMSSYAEEELKNATDFLVERETEKSSDEVEILVEEADKYLITDYFYHVMKQLRICHFKEEDRATRGGKRDNIEIGYGGLECIHCCRSTNARKFFWSNVDRLSNSFSEIPGHVLKCKACPESTKQALLEVKKHHSTQMTEKSRGSQKTFLRRVWRRMHVTISSEASEEEQRPQLSHPTEVPQIDSIVTLGSDSPDTRINDNLPQVATTGGMSCKIAAKALFDGTAGTSEAKRVLLAIDQDKDWGLSDLDCFVRQNLEVFCTTSAEAVEKGDDVTIGQVGIRCIHCSSEKDGYTSFPLSLDDLFSAVRAFKTKHLPQCSHLKDGDREKFDLLSKKCSSSFGSLVRQYYLKSAQALGLRDSPDGGIQATGEGGVKEGNDF